MKKERELQQYEQQLKDYEANLKSAEQDIRDKETSFNQHMSQVYETGNKQNLVEWELDFKTELKDIGHSLRCDVVQIDKDGNETWVKNPNEDKIILNELGVNDVLRKIKILVNKNKVLSYYKLEEVTDRVRLIGHELRKMIYNNYEAYGIDNEYKMINYNSLVLDVLDIIESAFRRAVGGETHKRLSEQRLVTQNENVSQQEQEVKVPNKKRGWLGF